jgi:hypothetical protein
MINLLTLLNAADRAAVSETNFQRLDTSLAFMLTPSETLDGDPTTALGPPTEGTFILHQLWVDALGAIWRCTVAGTPGTWIQVQAAVVDDTDGLAGIPNNYLIVTPSQRWAQFYYDGANWQPVNLQPPAP